MVYFGASAAIVVLERLAHTDPDLLPQDLRLAHFEFSGGTPPTKAEEVSPLPADWFQDASVTRRIGDAWLREGATCFLAVPSAILPEESNFVMNPQHPDAKSLRLVRERPFSFDPRLL